MRALAAAYVSGSDRNRRLLNLRRFLIFAAVATAEIFLGTFLFDFDLPSDLPYWQDPVLYANNLAKVAVVGLLLFLIVAWPRRQEIIEAHNTAAARWLEILPRGQYHALCRVALGQVRSFEDHGAVRLVLAAYSCLLLATGASMAFVAAPLSFWRRLLKLTPIEIAVAVAGASIAVGAGRLAQEGWNSLSSATLTLSHWFLTLYEPNVLLDNAHRILGVGNFKVQVFGPCSGYEGVALIVAFLPIYMWVFRRDLRFPNVLLLFPIGITAIWVLNALRIAVLVSIGAHVSPGVAVQGFHSEAGWISFLVVTLSCMAVSRQIALFCRTAGSATRTRDVGCASYTRSFSRPSWRWWPRAFWRRHLPRTISGSTPLR